MTHTLRTCAPLLLFCLASCVNNSPPLVCDPAKANQIAFGFMTLSQEQAGVAVIQENGSENLFVDGACNFWVTPNLGWEWIPVRRGQLTSTELAALNADVLQRGWSGFDGLRGSGNGTLVAWYDGHYGTADGPLRQANDDFKRVVAGSRSWISRLSARVEPMTAAEIHVIRLAVTQGEPLGPPPITPWPHDPGFLEAHARRPTETAHWGRHARVDGVEAATIASEWLRTTIVGAITFTARSTSYRLYARYSFPFEDADGLVRPPRWPAITGRDQ